MKNLPRTTWLAAAAATVMAGLTLREVLGHGLATSLVVFLTISVWAAVYSGLLHLTNGVLTRTHRCPSPGCDLSVTLRGVSEQENDRYAALAADHPAHRLPETV